MAIAAHGGLPHIFKGFLGKAMVLIKPLSVNMVISLQLIHELVDCLQFSLELVPLRLSESHHSPRFTRPPFDCEFKVVE